MKDLRLECISDSVTKLGDTNTQFLFKAYNDLDRVRFTDKQSIVFHLDSADKRSIDGIVSDGGESVGFSSASLKGLKPDTYKVEMWVTEGDKTDIYPTVGSLELTLNQNLVGDDTVTVVSSLKVDDFERRFLEFKQQLIQDVAKLRGPAGKSVYDVWLENGHTGTVTDFLQDMKGIQGNPGDTPVIGEDGNWHIGGVNTEQKALGKDGVGTWDEIQKYIDAKTKQFLTTDKYKFDNDSLVDRITKNLLDTKQEMSDYVDSMMVSLNSAVSDAKDANSKAAKLLTTHQLVENYEKNHFSANFGGKIDDFYQAIKLSDNATLIVLQVDASGFTYNSSNDYTVVVGTLVESLRPTFVDVTSFYRPYRDNGFWCTLSRNGQLTIKTNKDFTANSGCHVCFTYVRKG
ncbi:hypothetical protein [Limosilactobacillus oris]|uniref:hypothetical protein n=1 Tax=Limosilactobacillus oris TaxID=1632 RepID=UPI0022361AA3|nr:hypothetical protein [Limosilactobacillus oris]MCW4387541.1 hypothetical protein [Limosilactobacillus oris]